MPSTDAALEEDRMNALKEMRRTFGVGAWDETLGAFGRLGDLINIRTGIRIEAMCLAARAHAAKGNRKAAREILRPLRSRELPSPRLYGYLAASLLDLRDYQAAAEVCGRAADLALAKKESQREDQRS